MNVAVLVHSRITMVVLVHLLLVLGLLPVSYHLVDFRLTNGVKVVVSETVHSCETFFRIQSEHAAHQRNAFLRHFAYILTM
jgi:hypothetical protein